MKELRVYSYPLSQRAPPNSFTNQPKPAERDRSRWQPLTTFEEIQRQDAELEKTALEYSVTMKPGEGLRQTCKNIVSLEPAP